ncbi:unnamed protein product [Amaranthus hypochondriacus]
MKRKGGRASSSKQQQQQQQQESNNCRERSRSRSKSQFSELCSDLTSSIPQPLHPPKPDQNVASQADQIEHARNYIVELKERVDNLEKRKEELEMIVSQEDTDSCILPVIEVKESGNNLEVQLVIKQDQDIMLHQLIQILEEEGAEVVNASFSTSGYKLIHTLHAKARSARLGIEASRVRERLHDLI